MTLNEVTTYAVNSGVAVVTVDFPPVNALSQTVRRGLASGVRQALSDPEIAAIVLICGGRTFFAGADINEFGKEPVPPTLRDLQLLIEESPKPIIAAIHGTALGGGLELALAAHYRVAVPSAVCGLPEVKLGLLPGGGGTQRLPRIVGVERALEMMTSGEQITSIDAKSMGLLDALAPQQDLLRFAMDFAQMVVAEQRTSHKVRDLNNLLVPGRSDADMFAEFRRKHARRFRGFKALEHIVRAVEAAVSLPFDAGLAEERRLFEDLMADRQSAAQRYSFFAERQAARVPDIPRDCTIRPISQVGVIGAGTMGTGIAMSFLNAGLPVTLIEADRASLDRGLGVVRKNYDTSQRIGRLTPAAVDQRMGRLTGSLRLNDVADCDLVIEAVFEQMEVKQALFGKLDGVVKPQGILASNTSYLDIDAIAASTRRPESVIGLHFFSPANVMRLLEIVRGRQTSAEAISTSLQVAKSLGKVGVVVGNCHGFVGNRMLAQRQREADRMVLEGALPWQVDRVLYDFGFPMGPFAMRDLAGMDIGWNASTSRSSSVREILNEKGRHGQKSSRGYYDYDEHRRARPSTEVENIIVDFAVRSEYARRPVGDEEILDRCLYSLVNEGVKILAEGIATRPSDIDVIWATGYGWPLYRGGPMYWAECEGLPRILEKLDVLHAAFGEDFRPAPLLRRLVLEGKGFNDARSLIS